MIEPTPDKEEDELEDDFDPAPLSFFADAHVDRSALKPHALADVLDRDDRIATNVYRIYLAKLATPRSHIDGSVKPLLDPKKASRAYGVALHADHFARQRRRAALIPERHDPTEEETPTMPNENSSDAARNAATALAKEHGAPPTIAQVHAVIRKAHPDATPALIRQALKRASMPFASMRGQGRGAKPATDQKKPAAPRVLERTPAHLIPSPGTSTGNHLAIVALEAQRAKLEAQIVAIDAVIEGLRG